jgi:hypothetical protein
MMADCDYVSDDDDSDDEVYEYWPNKAAMMNRIYDDRKRTRDAMAGIVLEQIAKFFLGHAAQEEKEEEDDKENDDDN